MLGRIQLPGVTARVPLELFRRGLLYTFECNIAEIWDEFLLDMLIHGL